MIKNPPQHTFEELVDEQYGKHKGFSKSEETFYNLYCHDKKNLDKKVWVNSSGLRIQISNMDLKLLITLHKKLFQPTFNLNFKQEWIHIAEEELKRRCFPGQLDN